MFSPSFLRLLVFVLVAAIGYATFAISACQDGSVFASSAESGTEDAGGEEDERGGATTLLEEEQEHADHRDFRFGNPSSWPLSADRLSLPDAYLQEPHRPPSPA